MPCGGPATDNGLQRPLPFMRIAVGRRRFSSWVGAPRTNRRHFSTNGVDPFLKRLFSDGGIVGQPDGDPLILPETKGHASIDFIRIIAIAVRMFCLVGIPKGRGLGHTY